MDSIFVQFDVMGIVRQELKLLNDKFTLEMIETGLNDGSLITSMWYNSDATSKEVVVQLGTGKIVAEIISQEVDGEYLDFEIDRGMLYD